MLSVINIILGAGLLVSGRKLFWLFVAAGGFLAGVQFASSFPNGPEWLTLVVGLVVGIAFAILAMFLKTFAIGLAGFFLGGAIISGFASALGMDGNWIIYIIGGVIGIILVGVLFDWALISLSAFAGASLLTQAFNITGAQSGLVFFVLLIIGVAIQGTAYRKERKGHDD